MEVNWHWNYKLLNYNKSVYVKNMIENKEFKSCILIDTNGLITSIKYHVDIFYELKLLGYINFFVLQSVINELDSIILKKKYENKYAKIAKSLIKFCNVIKCNGYTDDLILDFAMKFNYSVFTNDKILKIRLIKKNICVVYLRNKKKLEKTI
mgnify:CR=1 FL=1